MLQRILCMGAPIMINVHPYFAAKLLLHSGVASAPHLNFRSKMGHCNITAIYTHAFPNTVFFAYVIGPEECPHRQV
jgi:hypothetical protein